MKTAIEKLCAEELENYEDGGWAKYSSARRNLTDFAAGVEKIVRAELIGQRDDLQAERDALVGAALFLLNCVRDYECDWDPEDLERVGEIRAVIARAEGQA